MKLKVPEVIYKVLKEPLGQDDLKGRNDIPQTLDEFMAEVKDSNLDAKSFALKLREMVFNISLSSLYIFNLH